MWTWSSCWQQRQLLLALIWQPSARHQCMLQGKLPKVTVRILLTTSRSGSLLTVLPDLPTYRQDHLLDLHMTVLGCELLKAWTVCCLWPPHLQQTAHEHLCAIPRFHWSFTWGHFTLLICLIHSLTPFRMKQILGMWSSCLSLCFITWGTRCCSRQEQKKHGPLRDTWQPPEGTAGEQAGFLEHYKWHQLPVSSQLMHPNCSVMPIEAHQVTEKVCSVWRAAGLLGQYVLDHCWWEGTVHNLQSDMKIEYLGQWVRPVSRSFFSS